MVVDLIQTQSLTQPINLLAIDESDMHSLVATLGWPKYRAKQILRWLYQKRLYDINEMTDLSLSNREQLRSVSMIGRTTNVTVLESEDRTKKFLLDLEGGSQVESVLIPDGDRLTLCVSTQVGCTLDCSFCLTGTMGLKRNLKSHEIVEQVLTAQEHLPHGSHLTSIVFMGMGEPLANLEVVSDAIERLSNDEWGLGISTRRMTLSTAGLASRLKEVATLGVNLAISLNATTNAQRDKLMPTVNRLHPLVELMQACRAYPLRPGRRITFEYVLLDGINASIEDARRLLKLLNGIRCKVNLIPFNEFQGSLYKRPSEQVIEQFQKILRAAGVDVFVRKSRGGDVLGACGQLGVLPT